VIEDLVVDDGHTGASRSRTRTEGRPGRTRSGSELARKGARRAGRPSVRPARDRRRDHRRRHGRGGGAGRLGGRARRSR
jgi:hypothetical protein